MRKTMEAYKKAISFNPQSDPYKIILREIAVIEMLITTGMRNNELRLLRFMDIDLANNIIFIQHGKGDLQRFSVFNGTAHAALKEYFASSNFNGNDLIFPYKQGNILNYTLKRHLSKKGNI